jgi:hypothetical protein
VGDRLRWLLLELETALSVPWQNNPTGETQSPSREENNGENHDERARDCRNKNEKRTGEENI